MKTLTKPYDLFDAIKTNFDYSLMDNLFYPTVNKKAFSNIKELDDEVQIEIISPGFKKNEIEITLDNDNLIVTGKKTKEAEKKSEKYIAYEYQSDDFTRTYKINPNLNSEAITSKLEDGILTIKVPKTQKTENKKLIKIT